MATVSNAYGTPVSITMTGIEDVDASSGLVGGWTSGSINNTSDLNVDFLLSGQFTLESTNISTTGQISIYVYGSFDATPTWASSSLLSAGTFGTVGALAFVDSEERDGYLIHAKTIATDSTASAVHAFSPISVASLFGGVVPPYWAVFVTSNAATSTNDWCVSSGTALYVVPVKYTVA